MDPKGKVILVTGASSGIGMASARELARVGATVVLTARSLGRLEAVAASLAAQGLEAVAIAMDVTDNASTAAAVAQTIDRFGRIDATIHFAGNGGEISLWNETSPGHLSAMIDTHLLGAERLARAVVPAMLARGSGVIVNVASTVGWVPMPGAAAYSAAKAAVLAFSDALNAELSARGVEVRIFAPPHTNTEAGRMWPLSGPRVFEPEWVARQLVAFLRADRIRFLAGSSNRLLLAIQRLSPGYARYIMKRIGLAAHRRTTAGAAG